MPPKKQTANPKPQRPALRASPFRITLQSARRFSESMLWDLQRAYFNQRGIGAWTRGEVPYYVTSNPTIASAYADIVFANWRDQERLDAANPKRERLHGSEPFTIVELGAGTGRFAFYFLQHLSSLCAEHGVPPTAFRYVLTDYVAANLDFWRAHPRFQSFFAQGVLDVARFDVERDETLELAVTGRSLSVGVLERPVAVIANYLFDSVPQDLLHFSSSGVAECRTVLTADVDPAGLDPAEAFKHVTVEYEYARDRRTYDEPWLEALVAGYAAALDDTHLLFPASALRCLHRLSRLSQSGLLLLSADKGDHELGDLYGRPPPALARHGSFSLNVNYHAIRMFFERRGGVTSFPPHGHSTLNVSCCLLVERAAEYRETYRRYEQVAVAFGPDEFFTVMRHVRPGIPQMSTAEVLAYLRLSRYDPHQFGRLLPRLVELAPALTPTEHRAVLDAVERTWLQYFPIGEAVDLSKGIRELLAAMGEGDRAQRFSPQKHLRQPVSPAAAAR